MGFRLLTFVPSTIISLSPLWFIDGKNIDTFDLEDILVQIMNDEFSVLLEDHSEQHIAKILEQLYLECTHGKYDLVETLKQDSQKVSGSLKGSRSRKEEEDDEDDSSDEDGEEGQGEEGGSGAMDVEMGESSSSSAARKEKAEPIIDEDGFETVVRKGKRR